MKQSIGYLLAKSFIGFKFEHRLIEARLTSLALIDGEIRCCVFFTVKKTITVILIIHCWLVYECLILSN